MLMAMDPTERVFSYTDWAMLAKQKLALLQAIDTAQATGDDTVPLHGILNWIDNLQDAAKEEGYPVVFLTEDEEIVEEKPEVDYVVTVQLFACSGDDIHVQAHDETEAEQKAQDIAQQRFDEGHYSFDLNEICISCTEKAR
jgi:HSP20 family molecular chaperone IbpA